MTDTKTFGLFGSSGFAREIMPLAKEILGDTHQLFFVENNVTDKIVNGYNVISEADFFALDGDKYFNIAIADPKIREKIATVCASKNITPLTLHSSNSTNYDDNDFGKGAIMTAYTTITSNAKIGDFFQANIYSYVAHDCVIGDYVTFAPRVHCNGNIHIHDYAYIGTGLVWGR